MLLFSDMVCIRKEPTCNENYDENKLNKRQQIRLQPKRSTFYNELGKLLTQLYAYIKIICFKFLCTKKKYRY